MYLPGSVEEEASEEDNEEVMGKPEHLKEGPPDDLDGWCHHQKETQVHEEPGDSTHWVEIELGVMKFLGTELNQRT